MALILYLNRAPRYENITAKEIKLIESYFLWKREREIGGKYGCRTFEEWGGVPESALPHKYAINYYRPFLTKKRTYVEGLGESECYSIFEQLARIVKANQIFNWFLQNVMNNEMNNEYFEVTREQLEALLNTCNEVKTGFVHIKTNKFNEDEYKVNEVIAQNFLPLMKVKGFFFGTDAYNARYAIQVNETIKAVKNILRTTDFSKQVIYFNASW